MATLASVSHYLSLSSVLSRHRDETRQEAGSVAIPKKGSRLISVDGTVYRWRIRHNPTYSQANSWGPLTYAVEPAEGHGRVLVVELPRSRPDAWLGERTMTVRPALVAATIRGALDRGWDPSQAGSAFTLNLTEDELSDAMNGHPPSRIVPFVPVWPI
ncbi:hypothetical protein [Streptosporangium sp. NPDC002524]|uniref:hypothetical protein n=1 Tax=Streptosporangium sp. NPDC002524 TaxID=3154537 RepID=UPI003329A1FD